MFLVPRYEGTTSPAGERPMRPCPRASLSWGGWQAAHSVIPVTVMFGGCPPPHLMWEL